MQEKAKRTIIIAAIAGVVLMGVAGWWIGGMGKSAKPAPQPDVADATVDPAAPAETPAVVEPTPPAVTPAPDGGVAIAPAPLGNPNNQPRITITPAPGNGQPQVITLNGPNGPRDVTLPQGMQVTQGVNGDPNATAIQLPGRNGNAGATIQMDRSGPNGQMSIMINGQTINAQNFRGLRQNRGQLQPGQNQPVQPDPAQPGAQP